MFRLILDYGKNYRFPGNHHREPAFRHNQRYSLVNLKIKWAQDKALDSVVKGGREVRAAWLIMSKIGGDPGGCLPIYCFSGPLRFHLGSPLDFKVSDFIRRYPNIFDEFYVPDSGGTSVPWFRLTPEAARLNQKAVQVFQENQKDFVDRVCKLLMLTKDRMLPMTTIHQLHWDLGLPYDYVDSFIPKYKDLFSLIPLPGDCFALKLLSWPKELAVSQLETSAILEQREEDVKTGRLGFRIGLPRGFGLKRKIVKWLEEWQTLPYTSPYVDSSHLDPRTDVSEKRCVGVFHELLHLTIQKKTELQNVKNLKKPLSLHKKHTKIFGRHPYIFYTSRKDARQTIVLREGYDRHRLVQRHPISEIRYKFARLMIKGVLDRRRGLYKKHTVVKCGEHDEMYHQVSEGESCKNLIGSEEESERYMFSEYESDETARIFQSE